MKKIAENAKITLTIGQLKRLTNENAVFEDDRKYPHSTYTIDLIRDDDEIFVAKFDTNDYSDAENIALKWFEMLCKLRQVSSERPRAKFKITGLRWTSGNPLKYERLFEKYS